MLAILPKLIVYVVNLVLLLIGLALGAAGAAVVYTDTFTNMITEQLANKTASYIKIVDATTLSKELMPFLTIAGYALMGLGILFAGTSGLALLGLCCHKSGYLTIYVVILTLLTVGQLFTAVYYLNNNEMLETFIHPELEKLVKSFKGYPSLETTTLLMQALHFKMECCGATNGSDFDDVIWNNTFSAGTLNGVTVKVGFAYPPSCCRDFTVDLVKELTTNNSELCPVKTTTINSNIEIGCSKKLTTVLYDYGGRWAAIGLMGAACFQIALLALTAVSFSLSK